MIGFWICMALAPMSSLLFHEFSHCLAVWAQGGKVTKFRPYPHIVDGHFFWGSMSWRIDEVKSRFWISAAPAVLSGSLILIYSALCFFSWQIFAPFLFWELMDHMWWWLGWFNRSPVRDGGKLRAYLESKK